MNIRLGFSVPLILCFFFCSCFSVCLSQIENSLAITHCWKMHGNVLKICQTRPKASFGSHSRKSLSIVTSKKLTVPWIEHCEAKQKKNNMNPAKYECNHFLSIAQIICKRVRLPFLHSSLNICSQTKFLCRNSNRK